MSVKSNYKYWNHYKSMLPTIVWKNRKIIWIYSSCPFSLWNIRQTHSERSIVTITSHPPSLWTPLKYPSPPKHLPSLLSIYILIWEDRLVRSWLEFVNIYFSSWIHLPLSVQLQNIKQNGWCFLYIFSQGLELRLAQKKRFLLLIGVVTVVRSLLKNLILNLWNKWRLFSVSLYFLNLFAELLIIL